MKKEGTGKRTSSKKEDDPMRDQSLDQEEDFPRGGGHGIAPVELKRIRQEAEAEVLGHNDGYFNTRSKKKKGKRSVVDEDDFFSSLSAMDTMPKYVELLKFKYLKSGMKLWGMITEIRATEMTVSLAHGLKGRVLLENASDTIPRGAGVTGADSNASFHLNTYFSLGSYVRCVIVKVTGKEDNQHRKSIDLSTRVSDVNKGLRSDALCEGTCISGCVKSVEDHGYLIDFGIKGTSGFLKKNQCPKDLLQGSNVDVVVSSIKRDGCAIVSVDPQEVNSCVTKEWSGIDVNSLLPGSLVNVKVRHVLSDGLAVSFLTFFNGTIDQFHLDKPLSNFKEGQTMKARIIWCNSEDKKVSLSMLPHLISRSLPSLPSQGEIFETAVVTRVDPGLGIAFNLPSKEKENDGFWKAYAHISNLSDKKVEDIQRRFKLGQLVPCRVIGLRPIDGLASVSLKPSVIEGTLVDISEIKPGLRVTGIVEKVDETCLKLRLSPHLRAHVPALHFSDAAHKKAHKKFKEGQVVNGKVLEVDRDKKKIIVTLKQTLLESKYPMLTSLKDASTGMRSHGVITGMKEEGVFVTFFNNFFGFIGKDHLGLKTSQSPQDAFTVGQVVKARVTGINSRSKTLRLSLLSKKQVAENAIRADTLNGIQPGQIVHGEIKDILKAKQADARVNGYIIKLDSADGKEILAKLDVVHLADHPVACQAFVDTLQVGSRLKNLVVLEKLDSIQQVRVTNKSSMRDAIVAGEMPENIDNLKVGSVIPGFVASVTANAVYVRFLNRVTGRAPLSQISDSFVSDPNSLFHIGMSVRAAISHVDLEKQTVGISLKESLCSQPDGLFIQSLFTDLERASMYDEDALQLDWASDLLPGSTVDVIVHSIKEYGILCDFKDYPDIVGLVANEQINSNKIKEGDAISAVIMEISKKDGIVDLCAQDKVKRVVQKSDPCNTINHGDDIEVTVCQNKVDEGYSIVNTPDGKYPPIGYLCIADYNSSGKFPNLNETITATAVHVPQKEDRPCRLVLVPKASKERAPAGKTGRKMLPAKGNEVEVTIDSVHSLHADIHVEENKIKGRIHIALCGSDGAKSKDGLNPLRSLVPGSKHKGRIIGLTDFKNRKKQTGVHVSLSTEEPVEWNALKKDQILTGYVQGVKNDHIWITYSPFVRGRAFIPNQVDSLEDCENASSLFSIGMKVQTQVLTVDPGKHCLDVGIVRSNAPQTIEDSFRPGTLVRGYIQSMNGGGVIVKIGPQIKGIVNLTDIHDSVAVQNVLNGIKSSSFVQASIISKISDGTYALSLRPSSGAVSGIDTANLEVVEDASVPKPSLKLSDLSIGCKVSGYVKSTGKMGVFVVLSRHLEARIKLRQLSDDFVENPSQAYPPGKLIQGKVMAIENDKVDITLRERKSSVSVEAFQEGQIVKGTVKRIEKFGVFVTIHESSVTGLAHLSELCDGYVQDVSKLFRVGQEVQARVIKVDKAGGKLSLGLKSSYFEMEDESDDGIMDIEDQSDDDIDAEIEKAIGSDDGAGESLSEIESEESDSEDDMDIDEAIENVS